MMFSCFMFSITGTKSTSAPFPWPWFWYIAAGIAMLVRDFIIG